MFSGCQVVIPQGPACCGSTRDRKSTRLNSSHTVISYAVFCLKKKNHDRTGADDRALADRHAGKEHRVHPDVRAVVDPHRLDDEVGLDDRNIGRLAGVLAYEELRPRPPPDVLAELHVAAVEVRLRSDPRVRADDAVPVMPSLQEG